jgi:diaminopimelate epimerase
MPLVLAPADRNEAAHLVRSARDLGLLRMKVDLGETFGNRFLLVHHPTEEGTWPEDATVTEFWASIARTVCAGYLHLDDTLHVRPEGPDHSRFLVVGGDGKIVTHCANGLLYAASRLASVRTDDQPAIRFRCNGSVCPVISGGHWWVDLGLPQLLDAPQWNVEELKASPFAVKVGEPHAVSFVDEVHDGGRAFERVGGAVCAHYDPAGVNWNLVGVRRNRLTIRTFERGVRRTTLSCGTGAAAAFHAARCLGRLEVAQTEVRSEGGTHHVREVEGRLQVGGRPRHRWSGTLAELFESLRPA